jgi:hypothetical protein
MSSEVGISRPKKEKIFSPHEQPQPPANAPKSALEAVGLLFTARAQPWRGL